MKKHLLLLCILLGLVGTRVSATYKFEINNIYYHTENINDNSVGGYIRPDYPSSVLTIPNEVTYNGKRYVVDYFSFSDYDYKDWNIKTLNLQKISVGSNVEILSLDSSDAGIRINVKELVVEDGDKELCVDDLNVNNYFFIEKLYLGRTIRYLWDFGDWGGSEQTLTSLTVGPKVTRISSFCFSNYTNLRSVVINGTTTIEDGAFEDCSNLESVVLNGSTTIENAAFSECINLKTVSGISPKSIGHDAFENSTNLTSIPLNLTENIGYYAFKGCAKLATASLDNCKEIKFNAFEGCSQLKTVNLGKNITKIGDECFKNCTSLSSISIPNAKLGGNIFSGCTSLKSVKIDCTELGGVGVFKNCSNLNSVEFSENLSMIGPEAFYGCKSLQTIKFPSSIENIQRSAFEGCSGITSLQFLNFKKSLMIQQFAFKDCTSLTSFVTPDGPVIDLGMGTTYPTYPLLMNGVFQGCTKLQTVVFNCGIIYPNTFAGCSNLKTITLITDMMPCTVSDINDKTNFSSSQFSSITLYVPNKLVDAYKTHSYWKQFKNIVGKDFSGSGGGGTGSETILVNRISLNMTSYSMNVGNTVTLSADVYPTNATNKAVKWSSSNTSVATVDTNGKVTAKTAGTAIITATATDGSNVSGSCTITVKSNSSPTQNRSGDYTISYDRFLTDGNSYSWKPPMNFIITIWDDGTTCHITNIFGIEMKGSIPFTYSDKNTATITDGWWSFQADEEYNVYTLGRLKNSYIEPDVSMTFDDAGNIHFGDLYIVFWTYDASLDDWPQGTAVYVFENLTATPIPGTSIDEITNNAEERCTVVDGNIILSTEQSVQVYNTMGSMVYSGVTSRIEGLFKGMYIVKTKQCTQKVIIK